MEAALDSAPLHPGYLFPEHYRSRNDSSNWRRFLGIHVEVYEQRSTAGTTTPVSIRGQFQLLPTAR